MNLQTGKAHGPKWGKDSTVAEVSSVQLEFRDLSRLTGESKYQDAVDHAMDKLQSRVTGLVPQFIDPQTGALVQASTFTLGARCDSYYEYLLKQWLQSGKTEER